MMADPEIEYGTIELDFPWRYTAPGNTHGANGNKGIKPRYASWSDKEILAFAPPYRIKEQAHLWVWAPPSKVHIAILYVKRLGFRWPGVIRAWLKPQPTNGYWFQGDLEYIVMGVRGPAYRNQKVKEELGYFPRTRIGCPMSRARIPEPPWSYSPCFPTGGHGHSSKPDEFYRETRVISPGSHLTLFQRTPRDGWHGAGGQYREGKVTFPRPVVA